MEKEMFTCFPNGIRTLLVDDDPKFLNSVTIALSSLHYKVATCRTPIKAVKLLSSNRVKDVDVVLADAHKVSACGFNLRTIVELDLCIPVIYFMSLEAPPPPAGDEAGNLATTVQSSTFILRKPLDMNEVANLWKVVAWYKCKLGVGRAKGGRYRSRDNTASTVARGQGGNLPPPLASHGDAGDQDPGTEEKHVHYKVVRADGRRRANHVRAGGSQQRRIAEHTNVMGIRRRHIDSKPSPLEEYHRAKLQKNNANCGTSSNVALPTPHVFQEQARNNADFVNDTAPAALSPAPLDHQQPATIAGPSNIDMASATPFTYRSAPVAATPVLERPSSAAAPAVIGDDSRVVASTLDLGAAPSEAAIELLLNIHKPLMVSAREAAASMEPYSNTAAGAPAPPVAPSQVPDAAPAENENEAAAAMVAELVAAPDNGGPAGASHGQGDEQIQATVEDWTFSLEDLQGLDIPGDMNGGACTVDSEDEIETWDLGTDQDFFLLDDIMDDTSDPTTLSDTTKEEQSLTTECASSNIDREIA